VGKCHPALFVTANESSLNSRSGLVLGLDKHQSRSAKKIWVLREDCNDGIWNGVMDLLFAMKHQSDLSVPLTTIIGCSNMQATHGKGRLVHER